jgi:ribosome-associated protein YbcJ (S4-like RNA binding protein)
LVRSVRLDTLTKLREFIKAAELITSGEANKKHIPEETIPENGVS